MGVSSIRNCFLFISFWCLCWTCVCDISDSHSKNLHHSELQKNDPDGGPNTIPQEDVVLQGQNAYLSSTSVRESSESHKQDVNRPDTGKRPFEVRNAKAPKFGDTFRRTRRRESQEQLAKRRAKLTHSEPHAAENTSGQDGSAEADPDLSEERTSLPSDQEVKKSDDVTPREADQVRDKVVPAAVTTTVDKQAVPTVDEPVSSSSPSPDVAEAVRPTPAPESTVPSVPSTPAAEAPDHGQHPHSDAMPSFDEWKKMMLAEQEKGGHKVPSGPPGKKLASQKRRRNYASYECGAKIVASNSESEGTSRILSELVDEYMLNPCKAKIWFVIELCESVQASQIELANFELFSSCPKDFAVYSSDSFPTRDWIRLGTFTAAEQRVLQSFELKQEGFGKFIKIELLSHYGKEHYCPLSVVRIFGTSMVDEYEEMETLSSHHVPLEDELDRLDLPVEDKSSSNLFGSATDAVYNIVKKAAQVLGQGKADEDDGEEDKGKNASDSEECRFINNSCAEKTKARKTTAADFFMSATSMRRSLFQHLRRCDQCIAASRPSYYSVSQPQCRFFQAALGPVLFNTICDWFKDNLITLENVPVVETFDNITQKSTKPTSLPPTVISVIIDKNRSETLATVSDKTPSLPDTEGTVKRDASKPTIRTTRDAHSITEEPKMTISPTRTLYSSELSREDYSDSVKTETVSVVEGVEKSSVPVGEESTVTDTVASVSVDGVVSATASSTAGSVPVAQDKVVPSPTVNQTKKTSNATGKFEPVGEENATAVDESPVLDVVPTPPAGSGAEDFPSEEYGSAEGKFTDGRDSSATVVAGGVSSAQKESVFMRMSNRIKALELNMTLSSQYLQELSQRYRRQMEEMQRAFNRTIGTLNDTARKAAERDIRQQEVISQLQEEVANLTHVVNELLAERGALQQRMLEAHIFLMVVEAIVMITIMSLCVRRISFMLPTRVNTPAQLAIAPAPHPDLKRRNSAEATSVAPVVRVQKRSVSEEVLPSSEELVVIEPKVPSLPAPHFKVKKKHRKKKGIHRSASNPTMSPRRNAASSAVKKMTKDDALAAAGIIFCHTKSSGMPNRRNNHACENCKAGVACSMVNHVYSSTKCKRPGCEPLKNLTNGKIESLSTTTSSSVSTTTTTSEQSSTEGSSKERFTFKKFLRLQKRESI